MLFQVKLADVRVSLAPVPETALNELGWGGSYQEVGRGKETPLRAGRELPSKRKTSERAPETHAARPKEKEVVETRRPVPAPSGQAAGRAGGGEPGTGRGTEKRESELRAARGEGHGEPRRGAGR